MNELQERKAALELELETLRLEQTVEMIAEQVAGRKQLAALVEQEWGARVDRTEFLRDTPGFGTAGSLISRPSDRRSGDNLPWWQTEVEHAGYRGLSRYLGRTDEIAIGALDNLANYCIGDGLQYKAAPKSPADDDLARRVQEAIDCMRDHNAWDVEREREGFIDSRIDGEYFYHIVTRGSRVLWREVDASFVVEPNRPKVLESELGQYGLDWKYGIATQPNRPAEAVAYFVSWFGDVNDWELIPAERMVHVRHNVGRNVKRGMADLFAPGGTLDQVGKLHRNMLSGSAVQAAIAYIREHAAGVGKQDIIDFLGARAARSVEEQTANGTRTRRTATINPGTVVDMPHGTTYHAGPLGTPRSTAYVEAGSAGMRRAGTRWNMPEYMISGDASNGNFSSTLVAESPFVKAATQRQKAQCRRYRELVIKSLRILAARGLFGGMCWDEVAARVDVTVTGPRIETRNKAEEFTTNKGQLELGMLSLETFAAESGRNLEEERRKGAKPTAAPTAIDPTNDPKSGPAPTPDNTIQDQVLNGAQMAQAVAIITAVAAGDIPRDAGVAQLKFFFRLDDATAENLMGSAGTGVETKPNTKPATTENPPPSSNPSDPPAPTPGMLESLRSFLSWRGYP